MAITMPALVRRITRQPHGPTKLTSVLKALREESQRARDAFAEKAFELETVRHAIHQAAARGQRSFRLKVPDTRRRSEVVEPEFSW